MFSDSSSRGKRDKHMYRDKKSRKKGEKFGEV